MNLVDILIHVDQELDSTAKVAVERELLADTGVLAARFPAKRGHLLPLIYDPTTTSAPTLLARVQKAGYSAQLVGL